ncbi:MAG: 3-isopropylmalate dehydratase small subunit, partial [Pseudonocardiaceae bacterium]|nr:3-isopropylmalate dehydratase small subunit [Pseudonocardiaceae bacterium]
LWKLLEAEPGTEVTVDLRDKTVRAKDFTAAFQIDDYTRWRLLEGLDDIALTLRHEDAIGSFEEAREPWKPTTSTLPAEAAE